MASGDPDRIARALRQLMSVPPPREPVPAPDPEVLDAFNDGPPGHVVRDYIWVIGNYRPFVPSLTAAETVRRWTEAAVRGGDGAAALQVVLYLRHEGLQPGADVSDVLSYVAARGVGTDREVLGAEYLARYFLDHSQTYDRAVRALSTWTDRPQLGQVLRSLLPYVERKDRAGLGL